MFILLFHVIEHKLEIFAWGPKINLVLATVAFIILYLWKILADKYVSIDDIEHVLQFLES